MSLLTHHVSSLIHFSAPLFTLIYKWSGCCNGKTSLYLLSHIRTDVWFCFYSIHREFRMLTGSHWDHLCQRLSCAANFSRRKRVTKFAISININFEGPVEQLKRLWLGWQLGRVYFYFYPLEVSLFWRCNWPCFLAPAVWHLLAGFSDI